ncbi:MAG: DUF992 domain-containing protein [Hyphomicrobium sp.]
MKWALYALACAVSCPALAATQANIGTLTCTLAESGEEAEAPPSQQRDMVCSFKPVGAGAEEMYSGQIKKVGTRSELDGKLVLIWVVMGPDEREMKPGLLEQSYIGELSASADGKAQAPKMLVGSKDSSYGLRPMTDDNSESPTGNVTVVELKVRSVPT